MKPANFPARKDARRVAAIVRFEAQARRPADPQKMSPEQCRRLADRTALALQPSARSVRTKKPRGIGR